MKEGVKFCGAMSELDIRKADATGGSAVGVIVRPDATYALRSPRSHSVDTRQALRLSEEIPEDMKFVLVPRTPDLDDIRRMADAIAPDRLQLAQAEDPPALAAALREYYGPDMEIAQVIQVGDKTEPEVIDPFEGSADIIHLDSPGRLPGGNNLVHDWSRSRAIAERAQGQGQLVILAGGLHGGNVGEAIATVQPNGVDVESSIRRFDIYNQALMRRFVEVATEVEHP